MKALAIMAGVLLWIGAELLEAGQAKLPSSGKLVYTMGPQSQGGSKPGKGTGKATIYWKGAMVREENQLPEGDSWFISDGKTAYSYNPRTHTAIQSRFLPRPADVLTGIPALKGSRKTGSGTYRGEVCDIWRIELPGGQGKGDIWISRKTDIRMRFISYGPSGSIVKEVTDLKTNIKLPDSLFKLPQGARIRQKQPVSVR